MQKILKHNFDRSGHYLGGASVSPRKELAKRTALAAAVIAATLIVGWVSAGIVAERYPNNATVRMISTP